MASQFKQCQKIDENEHISRVGSDVRPPKTQMSSHIKERKGKATQTINLSKIAADDFPANRLPNGPKSRCLNYRSIEQRKHGSCEFWAFFAS